MIVDENFIKKIKDLGLNSYEAKIWTALLSRGISTAGELSDIANVPRSRSYDVLESLEKKGFIIMKIGKPIKYISVPPDEAIERVKKKIQKSANTQEELLNELKESSILKELTLLHTNGVEMVEPTDMSAILKGQSNAHDHFNLMIKEAEETITISTTASGLIRKHQLLKKNLKKASAKGVKIRIAAPITKECKEAIDDLSEIAEIKHMKAITARFIIVDSNQISFMLLHDDNTHPNYDMGIWVNSPMFSKALEDYFELAWANLDPASKHLK
jgi:sugar-specific transcriptional regulator TrmB